MKLCTKHPIAGVMWLALIAGGHAAAQERTAYKHVDASGKITYTQTPPVDGRHANKVDIAPAQRGRGGAANGHSVYDDPRHYANQRSYNPNQYAAPAQSQQQAQEQRIATLKAECQRQRGTDCNDPAALRYQDSTSIPRRGRY